MIKRILLYGLVVSGLQSVIYLISSCFVWLIAQIIFEPENASISDYPIIYTLILFWFIVTFQNVIATIFNKKWLTISLFVLTCVIYLIGWGEDLNSFPFQAIVFIISGLLSLTIRFYLDKRVQLWEQKQTL